MKSYEVRYREILFTGEDYELAHKFFGDLLSKPFSLITPKETYSNKRFTYDPERRRIRLPCTFFEKLSIGDLIIIEKGDNEILISVERSNKTPVISATADVEVDSLTGIVIKNIIR
ncbi:MAG: hypothetical protein HY709_06275, partial [Candidatus Latescibacteria bacterium]|nr:hypothetical protein [Candidatus Latescibacterota bacterium]